MTIFSFDDYRIFLKEHKKSLPKRGWGFVSQLAEAIGASQVHVSQVLSGQKDLSLEHALLAAQFLGLNESEAEYLFWLVQSSRAGNKALKEVCAKKLAALRAVGQEVRSHVSADQELSEEQRSEFYSSYLYSAARHFSATNGGRSLEEICAKFSLPRARAQRIMSFLTKAGLCTLEKGLYSPGAQRTFVGRDSPHLARHHANWRMHSILRADSIGEQDILYTSPISLSRNDFSQLQRKLLELIKEISERVRSTKPEMVVCWNIDWFEV